MMRIVRLAHKNKIHVDVCRAMPKCLFSKNDLEYLKQKCSAYTKCFSHEIINPNGQTVFSCVNLHEYSKNIFRSKNIKRDFTKYFDYLKAIMPFKECKNCEYNRDKSCQAGCLSMRTKNIQTYDER